MIMAPTTVHVGGQGRWAVAPLPLKGGGLYAPFPPFGQ